MNTSLKLDVYDLKIIDVLQRDGRITKVKLAEAVHLSPTATWERLRRLEEAGIITGYQARIDLNRISPTTTVMVEITLKRHRSEDFKEFEKAVLTMPEITGCWATGGGVDYMMQVVAADVNSYQRFMDQLLESNVGVDRYFSYIVTKPVKEVSAPPVTSLAEDLS
ncbi:Lrp/AsnC family transcriptional regulator [Maridesulfovibrio bastinii]|uniref:Lrp/AsnC family transcriptional regulator n=1 Tax=Maridesulfovibrio bastinii TaxID=47157 RepID=UPI0003F6DE76|nr:Lrp/AsnC family transcriptional regulator [Maridesulfovibrio bastinii]